MKSKEIFDGYVVSKDGTITKNDGTAVKTFKSNKYIQCCLFDIDGKKHTVGVHTVVSMFYDDKWYDGCVVHHKDGDMHNNNLENLEVLDKSSHTKQHHKDGTLYRIGKFASEHQCGKNNPRAKAVRCIELNMCFDTAREAEKYTGVSHIGISTCCHGKKKTSGGYHWEFV